MNNINKMHVALSGGKRVGNIGAMLGVGKGRGCNLNKVVRVDLSENMAAE